MPLDKITRKEFDRRPEQSTERIRQERILLEEKAADLRRQLQEAEATLQRLKISSMTEDDKPNPDASNLRVLKVAGQFRDDPHYLEADRLGREWRDAQIPEYPADASPAK